MTIRKCAVMICYYCDHHHVVIMTDVDVFNIVWLLSSAEIRKSLLHGVTT